MITGLKSGYGSNYGGMSQYPRPLKIQTYLVRDGREKQDPNKTAHLVWMNQAWKS
jgi:hypothetical protein